jgi:hypothetical protein
VSLQVGKLGQKASAKDRRTLWYGRYASGPAYNAPPPLDDGTGDPSTYTWLGNDRVGCCTRTSIGHVIQQRCALLGQKCLLTTDHVLTAYKNGTGWDGVPGSPSDQGDSILNALIGATKEGIGPYKIRAFGRVNHHDTVEMRAALHSFGSVIVGASLPKAVLGSRRWDVGPPGTRKPEDMPGSLGGHAFIFTGHQRGSWWAMPWIEKTDVTYAWEDLDVEEAWFVIDDLWVTQTRKAPNGFDLAQIEADAAAIRAA